MKRIVLSVFILLWGASFVSGKSIPIQGVVSGKLSAQKKQSAEAETPYQAILVMEAHTGSMLEGENIHLQWAPASITKLMLVHIVMEKIAGGDLHLSDPIGVSGKASKMGGSQVFLKQGETFSLEELLRATLIASANDAAYAIAEYVSGSAEEFVQLMNQKANALNMADTVYHSVHGLPPSETQQADVSSCHDLSILARELLKYPKVLEWTAIRSEPFRDGKFILYNSNKLLGRMAEVDGLKTGYFRTAGYSIVATAKRGGLRLVAVLLGSPRARMRDRLVAEKLKKHFSQYAMVKVIGKGQVIDKAVVLPQGKARTLKGVAGSDFLYPVSKDKQNSINRTINLPEKIDGEIQAGQKLGELRISYDGGIVGKVDIVSPLHVPKAGRFVRLMRFFGFDF